MRQIGISSLILLVALSSVDAAESSRHVIWKEGTGVAAPAEIRSPEGTSRWQYEEWATEISIDRRWQHAADGSVIMTEQIGDGEVVRTVFRGPEDPLDALHWIFPEQDPTAYNAAESRVAHLVVEPGDGEVENWRVETRRVGVGWLHLPSGPREVFLQRVRIDRSIEGAAEPIVEQRHRWIDPRAGIVAESIGSLDNELNSISLETAGFVDDILSDAASLIVYADEVWETPFDRILYGWDTGAGSNVSQLTPEAYATIGDLIAANTWDFSQTITGTEQASTTVPLDATETCNLNQCGYEQTGDRILGRRDVDFEGAEPIINNQVVERTVDGGTGQPTLWLRAGRQKEGKTGAFGTGETGFCYVGGGRTEVPLWEFAHQDATGWYATSGDAWSSGVFQCEQILYAETCGGGGLFSEQYAQACSDHEAKQSATVIKGGVVTLPSGHTMNSLLVRTVADFCVYTCSSCSFLCKADEVRTVVYFWHVPKIGSVVLLQSVQDAADLTSWSELDNTLLTFGLLPPRTIQSVATDDASATISWDPGLDTHRIKDYVVYWDTDSGATTPYAFSSLTHGGQVVFNGTEATISGLSAGTQYFFTVTARSDYLDPVSSVTTTYESLLYPTQVSGDPSFVYPIEIQATTTSSCATAEATGQVVSKVTAPNMQICWDAIVSACLEGYTIQGAGTPESDANYTPVVDVGLVTCWTGNPTQTYFIVTGRGGGANWPWGHYGR